MVTAQIVEPAAGPSPNSGGTATLTSTGDRELPGRNCCGGNVFVLMGFASAVGLMVASPHRLGATPQFGSPSYRASGSSSLRSAVSRSAAIWRDASALLGARPRTKWNSATACMG